MTYLLARVAALAVGLAAGWQLARLARRVDLVEEFLADHMGQHLERLP